MNAEQFYQLCESKNACKEGLESIKGQSLQEFWDTTKRSDWMLWLIENTENDATDKALRLIAVHCARKVQHLMKDQRSIYALNVAERYANSEATKDELAAARGAAWAAALDAAGDVVRDEQCKIIRELIPVLIIKPQTNG